MINRPKVCIQWIVLNESEFLCTCIQLLEHWTMTVNDRRWSKYSSKEKQCEYKHTYAHASSSSSSSSPSSPSSKCSKLWINTNSTDLPKMLAIPTVKRVTVWSYYIIINCDRCTARISAGQNHLLFISLQNWTIKKEHFISFCSRFFVYWFSHCSSQTKQSKRVKKGEKEKEMNWSIEMVSARGRKKCVYSRIYKYK